MTGFGQGGEKAWERAAGHDINYLALSGILSTMRSQGQPPQPPINLLGDFGGGGLMCAFGVAMALLERAKSGKGQVVDAAMVDGVAYLAMFIWKARQTSGWNNELDGVGTNLLDGGAPFYRAYTCADGRHLSVGAIEPQFYTALLVGLGLDSETLPHQMDRSEWPAMHRRFEKLIGSRARDEWVNIFGAGKDACVAPVLSMEEATTHPHNQGRGTFGRAPEAPVDKLEVLPAPHLSRTPGRTPGPRPTEGGNTREVLQQWGSLSTEQVDRLIESGDVIQSETHSKPTRSRL